MQLNHLNLPVTDVAVSRAFFEKHFNFNCVDVKGNDMLAVLQGANGFVLTLMSHAFNKNGHAAWPDAFHFGFLVSDRQQVNDIWQQLKNDGITLDQEPHNMRGVFGFYFQAPGNILMEVSTMQ
jgi:catechol 2,3-dioxygenase-like lactoylglutathione lyase family enzyme